MVIHADVLIDHRLGPRTGQTGGQTYKHDAVLAFVLRGGSAVGRWTCDLQIAGSIPGRRLSRNIGQLSLASLRGR